MVNFDGKKTETTAFVLSWKFSQKNLHLLTF